MEIGDVIAYNLKRLREERHLSLGQLAEMAGVSKVMLSQLEKGSSNPTINTIWKITGALQLPYTSLLEMPESDVIHVEKKSLHELEEDGYHIFNYYAKDASRDFELYQIEMDKGCVHGSIGHSTDSTEYIMVVEGKMILEVNGKSYNLGTDDGFCFGAAVPHVYKQVGDRKTKMVLMINYT